MNRSSFLFARTLRACLSARMLRACLSALALAAGALVCLMGTMPPARAADASAWANEANSKVRLVAAGPTQERGATERRAGIEISLSPGWKTYWRYPGDSGVPLAGRLLGLAQPRARRHPVAGAGAFRRGGRGLDRLSDGVMLPVRVLAADRRSR